MPKFWKRRSDDADVPDQFEVLRDIIERLEQPLDWAHAAVDRANFGNLIDADLDAIPLALLRGAGINPEMVSRVVFDWKPGDAPKLTVTALVGIDPETMETVIEVQQWRAV